MDMQTLSVPRVTYSFAETSAATGLSIATLYRSVARGQLRTVKFGRRRLVPAEELARITRPQEAA